MVINSLSVGHMCAPQAQAAASGKRTAAHLQAHALRGEDSLAGAAGQAPAGGRMQAHAHDLPRRRVGRRQRPRGRADEVIALERILVEHLLGRRGGNEPVCGVRAGGQVGLREGGQVGLLAGGAGLRAGGWVLPNRYSSAPGRQCAFQAIWWPGQDSGAGQATRGSSSTPPTLLDKVLGWRTHLNKRLLAAGRHVQAHGLLPGRVAPAVCAASTNSAGAPQL